MIESGWADNQGVRLHYLDSGQGTTALPPLLYLPGSLGCAEDFQGEMPAFAPRRSLSVSLRGRGRSDRPDAGYSFEHQVEDLEALIRAAGLGSFYLVAYSMGVPIAIEYAARHAARVGGLVLCDYPARYPAYPAEWAGRVLATMPPERADPVVVHGLQRESCERSLWERLPAIRCPVLVIRGGAEGALLGAEQAERYAMALQDVEILCLERAGHALWEPDYERFLGSIRGFLARLDRAQ